MSLDETTTAADVAELFDIILGEGHGLDVAAIDARIAGGEATGISAEQRREDAILTHPTFNSYQSETDMLRYMKAAGEQRLLSGARHDPTGFLHHEAERYSADDPCDLA